MAGEGADRSRKGGRATRTFRSCVMVRAGFAFPSFPGFVMVAAYAATCVGTWCVVIPEGGEAGVVERRRE